MMKKTKLIFAAAILVLLFASCDPNPKGPSYTDEILNNSEWNVTNSSAITFNASTGEYIFDAQKETGGFKTSFTSAEPITVNFKIKTNLYYKFDGYMQFLIDGILINSYTGTCEEEYCWHNEQYDVSAGTHTFEWKRYDPLADEWTDFAQYGYPNAYVSLKEIKISDQQNTIKSINQTTTNGVNANMWVATGLYSEIADKDPVFASWPQYGKALVDTHGKVLKLPTYRAEGQNTFGGNSILAIYGINITEESALSFDYKCDLLNGTDSDGVLHKNWFKVYVDNNTSPSVEASGTRQAWQNASVILPAGSHNVKFVCGSDDGWFNRNITNATYIDNITLVPNTLSKVDIYPKGIQETYVNGDAIQFSAKALRSDGSVISGKTVTWSATGGSIDANGKFTPGTSEGTFTVTATIDGVTASNQTVEVHGTNYLSDPVTINGNTFTGTISNPSGRSVTGTNNISFSAPTPAYTNFTTNGFFVLKGTATNTKGVSVFIRKQGPDAIINGNYNPDYKYQGSFYIPDGAFEQRIWLRFGDGSYDVYVEEVSKATICESYDGYEGAVTSWWTTGESGTWAYFNVTNNTGLNWSAEDCAYLMPSAYCQCDDLGIISAFNGVMAELPENATLGQKLQALYDWESRRSHYDFESFTNGQSTNKRKKQDAVHVLKYGTAVCEGYADLYTAFARLLGVKAAYQTSNDLNHAWTELYYDGAWKMVDITWDDPSDESANNYPTAENYWYFLIDPNDVSHIKEGKTVSDRQTDYSRTAATASIQ